MYQTRQTHKTGESGTENGGRKTEEEEDENGKEREAGRMPIS